DLARFRVTLRFERQRQFELAQRIDVLDCRNRAVRLDLAPDASGLAILFSRSEENQESELRIAVDLLGQPKADLRLVALSHQTRADVARDLVTHRQDSGIRQLVAGRGLVPVECAGETDDRERGNEDVSHGSTPFETGGCRRTCY